MSKQQPEIWPERGGPAGAARTFGIVPDLPEDTRRTPPPHDPPPAAQGGARQYDPPSAAERRRSGSR